MYCRLPFWTAIKGIGNQERTVEIAASSRGRWRFRTVRVAASNQESENARDHRNLVHWYR